MSISALCFSNVANRSTFSPIFKRDIRSRKALAHRREVVVETIVGFVKKGG
jgi:hypothetical protein